MQKGWEAARLECACNQAGELVSVASTEENSHVVSQEKISIHITYMKISIHT